MTRPNLRELIRMGRAVQTTTATTSEPGEENSAQISVTDSGTSVTLMAEADGGTLDPVVEVADAEGNWYEAEEFSDVTVEDGESIAVTETVAAEEVQAYADDSSDNLGRISLGISL